MATAIALGYDTVTRGNWVTAASAVQVQGYDFLNDSLAAVRSLPPWLASVTPSGSFATLFNTAATSDGRYPQAPGGSTRLRGQFQTSSSYGIELAVSDAEWHRVGLYSYDYANGTRRHRVEAYDAAGGPVLASQAVAFQYSTGVMHWFAFQGSIRLEFVLTAGPNAGHSGLLFGAHHPHYSSGSVDGGRFGHYLT